MNCEQQEWIDLYLFGELKGEELLRFEAKMQEDADFREDVHLQEEIFLGIRSYCAAKPIALRPDLKLVWIKRAMNVAAVVALAIMAAVMFQTTHETETAIADNNIEMNNDEINNLYHQTDYQEMAYYGKESEENSEEDKDDEEGSNAFMNYPKQFEDRA